MNLRIMALIIVGLLFGSMFVILGTDDADSYYVDSFGNPATPNERIITLAGNVPQGPTSGPPFKDATTFLELPTGPDVILPDSNLRISTHDIGDGRYATSPSVDVGMDGDLEWAFSGTGYGKFGY
jgi:hypothetical protein